DCSIRTGDRWMKKHLDRYAWWAIRHNRWLVVTFDENAGGTINPIPTIILGDHVHPGRHAQKINHYTLLRTIEDALRAARTRPRCRRVPAIEDLISSRAQGAGPLARIAVGHPAVEMRRAFVNQARQMGR
ncbi:MAG TPA: alkaline phosphatase family protein, partial [Propionibacteriaceae bacterium]|nr:alkaline phosphatase family protein [Propionibacteriaceae bacterium]